MSSVVVTSTVDLASAPSDVWPLITDTDRSNRITVGAGATYRPIEEGAKTSARFVAETRAGGFDLSYEEAPFEWTLNKSFSVFRKMRSGPLHSYTYGITLEPTSDGGTRVGVRLELAPRHWLISPIARIQGNKIVASTIRLAQSIDDHLRDKAPSPYLKPQSEANADRLAFARSELAKRTLDPRVIDVIIDLIKTGSDADVTRIRPLELAADKGVDGRELLRGFLHATTVGLVELRWALVCPSCRTANDQVSSLAEVGAESHCQLCDLSYGIELDRAVEATFVPHPSVREVPNQMFCIGGPWRTPHVMVQAVLGARARKTLEAPSAPGRYRLFVRGGAMASIEVVEGGAKTAAAKVARAAEGADRVVTPPELTLAPGGALEVENASADDLHVKIERLGYASLAATAQVVTTMSEFRRFFSRDLLKPSTPLKVASCAILFSDLTGSTALYTKAGDAAAFRLVDDHFDILRKVIDEAGGTVVKTMGDAIMASFLEPVACVAAAMACLEAFERFRVDAENGELTGIKLGLYAGPCYVITANETIDYFGQTVNCASRVQHCAESGEIVFEAAIYEALPSELRQKLRLIDTFETKVKGVEEPLRLVRVKLVTEIVSERSLARRQSELAPPPA